MLDLDKIKELSNLVKQPVENIRQEGQMTYVEFADGQILPLYGGTAGIEGLKSPIHECSFCGHVGNREKPVVSLTDKDEPLICPDCAVNAIQTFVQNGIEIELDISNLFSEETINKMIDLGK